MEEVRTASHRRVALDALVDIGVPILLLWGLGSLLARALEPLASTWTIRVLDVALGVNDLVSGLALVAWSRWRARIRGIDTAAWFSIARPALRGLGPGILAGIGYILGADAFTHLTATADALVVLHAARSSWSSPGPMFVLALAIPIAAIGEEALFRGCLPSGLQRAWSPLASLALATVLFGLWHSNLPSLPWHLGMGLLLGWLALTTGSLWAPTVCHALTNIAWQMGYVHGWHWSTKETAPFNLLVGLVMLGVAVTWAARFKAKAPEPVGQAPSMAEGSA